MPETVGLHNFLIKDAGLDRRSSPIDVTTYFVCCHNITALLHGTHDEEIAALSEMVDTDVFIALRPLAFLSFVEDNPTTTEDRNEHVSEDPINI